MTSVPARIADRTQVSMCIAGISLGLGIAALLAPKDSYFLGNVAWYWLPHAAVIALLLALRVRPSEIGGFAVALAVYLIAYYVWLQSKGGQSLAWLGYLYSMPGAAVSAVVMRAVSKRKLFNAVLGSAVVAFLVALAGVGINQAIVCATLMYCG